MRASIIRISLNGLKALLNTPPLSKQNFLRLLGHAASIRIDLPGDRVCALHRRSFLNPFEPAFEIRKIIEILTLPFVQDNPRIASHVGDRIIARDKFTIGQTLVEYTVEA